MKIRYWVPSYGQTQEDAYEIETRYSLPDLVADDCAEDYHSNHDGWESDWPLVFHVDIAGEVKAFQVFRETVPAFRSLPVEIGEKP